MNIWEKYNTPFWILISVSIYVFILMVVYVVLKFAFGKKLDNLGLWLIYYFTLTIPFLLLGEVILILTIKGIFNFLFWILISVSIYVFILMVVYVVLKFAFGKKLGDFKLWLTYFTWVIPFWLLGEITSYPRRRKRWLIKSGLKEGHSYLEEGIGVGTSPILASKIVGDNGVVHALDNHPMQIAILKLRSKIRRIKNIRLIFSDASETGLEDNSIDTIFICDAFDEFPDKKKTTVELYRILKPGGNLTILSEAVRYANQAQRIIESTNLFKLVERDKNFIQFKKER